MLHCRNGYTARLDALVEAFVKDGVTFVGVVGEDCGRVEDIIDELVVGDATRDYDLLTSSHPGESLEYAVEFARSLELEYEGAEVQIIELYLRSTGRAGTRLFFSPPAVPRAG